MVKCAICSREFNSYIGLGAHIGVHDGISSEEYYNKYTPYTTGICLVCKVNPTRFVSISKGYKPTCSNHCGAIYGKTKRELTSLSRFGTKNPTQSSEVKAKISATVKSEECQERTRETNNAIYGYDRPMQSLEVKNKAKETINNKFGERGYSELSKMSWITRRADAIKFEKEHDCTQMHILISEYGQGWLSIKNEIELIEYKGLKYVKNCDIQKILDYVDTKATRRKSYLEKQLVTYITSFYNPDSIIENSRQIIKPLELDIYLPDLNLAIEFNGTWYHSIEKGCSKNAHLNKSLICRDNGIRLIHIYEFEDLEVQKQLLKDLILGIDNYPKNDFNKNNLSDNIPESCIIYNDNRYTVYGAGPLF